MWCYCCLRCSNVRGARSGIGRRWSKYAYNILLALSGFPHYLISTKTTITTMRVEITFTRNKSSNLKSYILMAASKASKASTYLNLKPCSNLNNLLNKKVNNSTFRFHLLSCGSIFMKSNISSLNGHCLNNF